MKNVYLCRAVEPDRCNSAFSHGGIVRRYSRARPVTVVIFTSRGDVQSSLKGELIVMPAFKDIRERVFGGGYSFDSIRGSRELSSGNG